MKLISNSISVFFMGTYMSKMRLSRQIKVFRMHLHLLFFLFMPLLLLSIGPLFQAGSSFYSCK